MSALSENFKITSDCSKPGLGARNRWLKWLGALPVVVVLGAPWLSLAQAQVPAAMARAINPAGTILIVGDSLSAEYGLKRGTGWVKLLEQQLIREKKNVTVVNASISGETTSGGYSRLPALLAQHRPTVVVIELGGNDALRGLPLDMTEKNLTAMTQSSKKAGAKVLLVGMQVPPNYGAAYANGFSSLFSRVAKAEKVALVPFLLKGIADAQDPVASFQADRIHPNESSQARMLANAWPELKKLLK